MADSFYQQPDDAANTGKKVDADSLTVGANTVYRQRIQIADPTTAAALTKVTNAAPGVTDYGIVARLNGDLTASGTLSAAGASGNPNTTNTTAGSFIGPIILNGHSTLIFTIVNTGTAGGNVEVQVSLDGTTWFRVGSAPIVSNFGNYSASQAATATIVAYMANTTGWAQVRLMSSNAPTSNITAAMRSAYGQSIMEVGGSASNPLGQVNQGGTWTVQPGNTANTTPWLVRAAPFDACGATSYDPAALKIPDATLDVLTASTTCVDTIVVTNVGSAQATITVQDTQGTPVQLLNALPIAPGASTVLNLGGVKFASGIKYQASASNTLSIWVKGRQ